MGFMQEKYSTKCTRGKVLRMTTFISVVIFVSKSISLNVQTWQEVSKHKIDFLKIFIAHVSYCFGTW